MTDTQMLEMMKLALGQVLDERREFFREVFEEIMEDVGLAKAMEEERDSPIVPRSELTEIFDAHREHSRSQ